MSNLSGTPNLQRIAQSTHTILITGRTGTGKTHMARTVHDQSLRSGKAFTSVNLATLNENLIESELFGHEKGAFSGADCKRIGKLESGNGGTIFLDEIGELSSRLQTKLLDALNHKVISPVGSNREIKLDVRIIAATNRDLEKMVEEGTFREDLFYRLNTFQLQIPSLSESRDRILPLAEQFISHACQEQSREKKLLSPQLARALELYHWPGNIRELKNALEFTIAISAGSELLPCHLPPYVQKRIERSNLETVSSESRDSGLCFPVDFQSAKEQFERQFLQEMLRHFDGKVNLTARKTKMSKVTLIEKIRRYEINLEAIKYENYSQRSH